MTQEEKGQLFFQMKTARDAARDTLLLSRKKAQQLERQLAGAQAALRGEGTWIRLGENLRFTNQQLNLMDCSLPTEADILDALETIRDSEKAIQEYDEFVR